MSQCLAANEVIEIAGILNGNDEFYPGHKMIDDSMDFSERLRLPKSWLCSAILLQMWKGMILAGKSVSWRLSLMGAMCSTWIPTEGISAVTLSRCGVCPGMGQGVKLDRPGQTDG